MKDSWVVLLLVLLAPFLLFMFLAYHAASNMVQVVEGGLIAALVLALILATMVEGLVSALVGGLISTGLSRLGCFPASMFLLVSLAAVALGLAPLFKVFVDNLGCGPTLAKLAETPFNRKLLVKCPATKPLAALVNPRFGCAWTNGTTFF